MIIAQLILSLFVCYLEFKLNLANTQGRTATEMFPNVVGNN